ncbi:uncharacterized protein PV07_08631 [Cladophialophora immunda]|uniref:Uncharacterized protein n=1 Tax=Cladophialophora immunda TaxID=569365 RepID=A0A0D2CPI6_9EURO|nr:uncharacterized protein PV07_08631 [Cladophialophora immunda]KIW25464.1 hypothetical protein PV07_08631 [Cladophialophora immunda]OQV11158.1 hypothetical protein CLAIMM_15039 [Cladophialophora immunda]
MAELAASLAPEVFTDFFTRSRFARRFTQVTMFNSFLFCSALNAVFALPYFLGCIGSCRAGRGAKNRIYLLSSLANSTTQVLFAVLLIVAAARHWRSKDAVAIARSAVFCESMFEVIEILRLIEYFYLRAWGVCSKLSLMAAWLVITVGLMALTFVFDDNVTSGTLFLFAVVANYEIKIQWAGFSIPWMKEAERKHQRRDPPQEPTPASVGVLLESLRAFFYTVVALVALMGLLVWEDKWPFLYSLQLLLVNLILGFAGFDRVVLYIYPKVRQPVTPHNSPALSPSLAPDSPPEDVPTCSGGLC